MLLNGAPWLLEVGPRPIRGRAGHDEGAVAIGIAQQRERRSAQHDRLPARLAISEQQQAPLQIDMGPLQVKDLAKTRAREEKQAKRESDFGGKDGPLVRFFHEMLARSRVGVEQPGKPFGLCEPQRFAETLEFFCSKKPFPLGFRKSLEANRGVSPAGHQTRRAEKVYMLPIIARRRLA